MRILLLLGERGSLHLCVAILRRIYGMRTKRVAFFQHCLTKLWLMQKSLQRRKKRKDSHYFGILCKCRWRKRKANCDRKIILSTVLQGHKGLQNASWCPLLFECKSLDEFGDHVGYSQQDQPKACTTEEKSDFISGQCQLTFSGFGWKILKYKGRFSS